ncbi:hypothetical protein KAR91_26570, partial [Candidatus Pacearchaeota archaeon]|nr:hypothetical protein [Candidatus Pacearchaeota archaeon]
MAMKKLHLFEMPTFLGGKVFIFNENPYFQRLDYADHFVGLRTIKRNFVPYCIYLLFIAIAYYALLDKNESLIAVIIEGLNAIPYPALILGMLSGLLSYMFQKQYYFLHIGKFIRPMVFTAIVLLLYFVPITRISLIIFLSPLVGIISVSLSLKLFSSAIKSADQTFQKRATLFKRCRKDLSLLSEGSFEISDWSDYDLYLPAEDVNIWNKITSDYTDLKNELEQFHQNGTLNLNLQYMNPNLSNNEDLTGDALRIYLLFSNLSKVFRYD